MLFGKEEGVVGLVLVALLIDAGRWFWVEVSDYFVFFLSR